MRVKHLFFLGVIFFITIICRAQNPNPGIEIAKMQFQAKQVVPPSPDAAELGRYGNVPVSLFTGTPSISVPLFELKGNSVSLPISLSYNASGFKPEDAAPWVGSGWSLNGGGVITRAVMGNPDNDNNYFGVANVLTPPTSNHLFDYYDYMEDVRSGVKEAQPDVYYYNFAGRSGKFVLKPDYSVFTKEKDLKIITPCISSSCFNSKFTIVDEQGITYVFEAVETTKMIPNDDAGNPSYIYYTFVSAWYLTSMYSPLGDAIEFEYHSTVNWQDIYSNTFQNKSVSYTYGYQDGGSCCGKNCVNEGSSTWHVPPIVSMKRKFLSKIILKNYGTTVAYIDVVSAAGAGQRDDSNYDEDRRVNQIKIYSSNNGQDKLIKQFNLSYGYFGNAGATGSQAYLQKRLRLESVQEISTNVNVQSPPAYVFTYDNNFSVRFTASLDHWGFYNASNNTSLVPGIPFPASADGCHPAHNIGDGANREASLTGSMATMLTKMQYPTGGHTTFEYELNKVKFSDNVLRDAGGVRVKQIIDYSFQNKQAVVKNYSYTEEDGITSSGKGGNFPEYKQNSSFHHYPGLSCCSPLQGCTCESHVWPKVDYTLYTISISANSIFGLGSFQGSHIGYSRVTETTTDLSTNQSLGKTVYNYTTSFYDSYDDHISNGDLYKKSVYRNDGKLLQEEVLQYEYNYTDHILAHIIKGSPEQDTKPNYCRYGSTEDYHNYSDNENPPAGCTNIHRYETKLYIEDYMIQKFNKKLLQQVIKIYDQLNDNYLTTTKSFSYGNANHNYPTLIEETTTNGEKVKTEIKYVADYDNPPSPAGGSIADHIRLMKSWNMLGLPIEKLQYRTDANGNNRKYTSGQITDYVAGFPVEIYFLEAQPPLTSVVNSYISSSSFYKDNNYRAAATMSYDNLMNVVHQSKTNDVSKSYIWDYNQTYPIAEITGATNYEVSYTSFESNGKGGFSFSGIPTGTSGITGNKYYDITGNPITGSTNPAKSYTLSYWRYNNTSPFTVTNSSGFKQGATKNNWTLFEHTISNSVTSVMISGSGIIDELRLYPTMAIMTTQTFEPLVGINSQCTANNQLLYYEYDGLNRLLNIRDDDGNIVKNFKYNYGLGTTPTTSAQSLWYSAAMQGSFARTNCSTGTTGTAVIYKVPYGKYVSSISQQDADSKATTDRDNNGPAYANANGLCVFYNTTQSGWFLRTNCLPDQGPGTLSQYTIPANTYYSTISVAHANELAQAALPALGNAWVNIYGHCHCEVENTKYLNGDCIVGVKKYIGNGLFINGQYHCPYKYYFAQDGTWSVATYTEIRSTPCPEND